VRGRIRGWWPLITVAPFLVAVLWLLYVVWKSSHRLDLATYGAFAVPVVTLMAGWITWAWRAKNDPANTATAGHDMDRVADLLAVAVKTQWERAAGERGLVAEPIPIAWGRPSLPLAGPIAAAVGSRRFSPLPGFTPAREAQLTAGQINDLHTIYGGLRSGRLVIAGAPGSGKSGAAVLLVIDALKYRDQVRAEDRAKVPVPVLFTVQDWDARSQPLKGWLTRRLQQTYPLLAGHTGVTKAGALIDTGKLTVILDGLDEIAEGLRPIALQALDQASFRIVVLSRTAEMASAASQRGLLRGAAAVELRAIDPITAAGYLERVQVDPLPDGWRDLIERIRTKPTGPLAEALNTPLALTLIRDTYQSGDDARELLDKCDTIRRRASVAQAVEEITSHLLDRVLPAAYARRPGKPPPRYDLQTAQNALAKIAARMNDDGTRDLYWWHIPRWAPSAPRVVWGGIIVSIAAGVIGGPMGFLVGIPAGIAARGTSGRPARIGNIGGRLRLVYSRRSLKFGLAVGIVTGIISGLGSGLVIGLGTGLTWGLISVLILGLAEALRDPDSTGSPSPAISWRYDKRHSIAIGLLTGFVVGLVAGIGFGLMSGLFEGILAGFTSSIGSGLIVGFSISRTWPTTLAVAQLAKTWHTPLRLMNFLDDAHERSVLRTVGPVYQFRHSRLQDRLAGSPDRSE
jgi:hypothetical protein